MRRTILTVCVLVPTYMGTAAAALSLNGRYIARVPHDTLLSVGPGRTVETAAGKLAAVYLISQEPAVELVLFLEGGTTAVVQPDRDARAVLRVDRGTLALRSVSSVPVIVSFRAAASGPAAGGGWVRVEPGSALLRASASGEVALVEGRTTRFAGAVPPGEPQAVQGGEALTPHPQVRAEISRLAAHLFDARVMAEPDSWLNAAESGDLVPGVQVRGVVPEVPAELRPEEVTVPPQMAALAPPTTTITPTVVTPSVTEVQALLSSQNPASVVVGARLARTRIVGTPGTAGAGSGVRFNPQAQGPLHLGPRIR